MTLQRQEQREGIVTPADFRMFSELWVQYSLPAGWWESMISTFPHEYKSNFKPVHYFNFSKKVHVLEPLHLCADPS